jgi:transcriptional regulator with GAF, ATPase, and Fis domain
MAAQRSWLGEAPSVNQRVSIAIEDAASAKIELDSDERCGSRLPRTVGNSFALRRVLGKVGVVAPTDATVLINGETGTGKELFARAIHWHSRRSAHAFVSMNCAAVPLDLVASELFGQEKGAFTGATQRRLGRFEMADGGTIFLDEVGELLPGAQVILLRVLQEREFERVGGGCPRQVDVRVIAATNRDLRTAVSNGKFREDLFYRLNVFPIEVPPLRERKDDILMLVKYFVRRYADRLGKNIQSIDKGTLDLLHSYDWPGNIRELQNVIERSVILTFGDVLSVDALSFSNAMSRPAAIATSAAFEREAKPHSEREIVEAALAESRGRVSGPSGAAIQLAISPSTLENRIKALKIDKRRFRYS